MKLGTDTRRTFRRPLNVLEDPILDAGPDVAPVRGELVLLLVAVVDF